MPKSGQAWNPQFLKGHPLFVFWEEFAAPFRGPAWPRVRDYSRALQMFSERAIALDAKSPMSPSAPPLAPLSFRRSRKKSRRQKRTKIDLGALYDGSIALAGEVPCLEESYHDLLNAIVFCAFPRSKRLLHQRQYRALHSWLERSGALADGCRLPGRRTREQDALTIFDEGGTLIVVSQAFRDRFARQGVAVRLSETLPSEVVPLLFGHGLLEHLFEQHVAIRSSGYLVTVPSGELPWEHPEALFDIADRGLYQRLADPDEFCTPRADVIFELEANGEVWIRAPRSAVVDGDSACPRCKGEEGSAESFRERCAAGE